MRTKTFVDVNKAASSVSKSNPHHLRDFMDLEQKLDSVEHVAQNENNSEMSRKWLTVATRLYDKNTVEKLIEQVSTLNSDDVMALWHYHEGSYFPEYGISEVWKAKKMQSLAAKDIKTYYDQVATQILSDITYEHYKVEHAHDVRERMTKPDPTCKQPWMRSDVPLVVKKDEKVSLIDIGFGEKDSTNLLNIKLNYENEVAKSRGVTPAYLYHLHYDIDAAKLHAIVENAGLDRTTQGYKSAKNVITQLINQNRSLVQITPVQHSKDLAIKLNMICMQFNRHLRMTETMPSEFNRRAEVELTDQQIERISSLSKEITSADAIKRRADERAVQGRKELKDYAASLGLQAYTELPIKSVTLNADSEYDYEAIVKSLEMHGVAKASLYETEWDVEGLLNAARSAQAHDISQFRKHETINRERVIQEANNIGLDLRLYREQKLKVYMTGQTRNAIADEVNKIRTTAAQFVDGQIDELNKHPSYTSPNLNLHQPKQQASHFELKK